MEAPVESWREKRVRTSDPAGKCTTAWSRLQAAKRTDKSVLLLWAERLAWFLFYWKLLNENFTSRLTLINWGSSIMSFKLIWQGSWCHKNEDFVNQKFSSCVLSAVTVHDLCPDLLSSQQRRPSMQSCPGWWRQWWGWPLAYGPAWGRGRTDIIIKTADRIKHIINDLLFYNCNAMMGVISCRIHHNPLHLRHTGDVVEGLITLNIYPW